MCTEQHRYNCLYDVQMIREQLMIDLCVIPVSAWSWEVLASVYLYGNHGGLWLVYSG
jgi:hypothetical protein